MSSDSYRGDIVAEEFAQWKKSESSYSKDSLEYNTVRILKRITKMSKRLDVSGNSVKINICFSWWKFWEICDIYKDFLINQHLLTGPWVWTWLVLTQFLREHSTQSMSCWNFYAVSEFRARKFHCENFSFRFWSNLLQTADFLPLLNDGRVISDIVTAIRSQFIHGI